MWRYGSGHAGASATTDRNCDIASIRSPLDLHQASIERGQEAVEMEELSVLLLGVGDRSENFILFLLRGLFRYPGRKLSGSPSAQPSTC